MFAGSLLLSSLFYFCFVNGDWQYRSRPDLSPPRLNITIPAKGTSDGYLFVAPFSGFPEVGNSHGPRQAAPYIFNDKGELVWSGFSYYSIWATNFQAGKVNGKDILFSFEGSHNPGYGHGHGHITLLDQNYETVKELRAGNHKIIDKHEFHIIDGKTGLVQIYQPTPYDLSKWASSKEQQWIVNAIFQELDIETGDVLFEWSSLDHISPDESVLPVDEGQAGAGFNSSDAWDYFHINSVDKDANGDYLLSARDAASVYKVDGKTGEIIWKLGGLPGITTSDFQSEGGFNFSFQHHARYLYTSPDSKKQIISLYDNSAHGTENKDGKEVHYNTHSSGKIIEVDTSTWTAKLLFNGVPPDGLLSKSQGSTQVLPNGNVLVNWGSEGAVTEFDANEKPIFHAYMDSGDLGVKVENYRAFKYNWTGIPNEEIALYSEHNEDRTTTLYVSWNGDTQTKTWKFYTIGDNNSKEYIGKTEKSGFETVFTISEKITKQVIVEAYGASGEALASSSKVTSVQAIKPYDSDEKIISQGHEFKGKLQSFQSYFDWKKEFTNI
ncbi:hypothetical protein CANTEDRAFT_93444 [Yamadazyma tenuis ATCC 10573]|uniref:Arylsulfotransferase n=1 Tax=Candida tenuis (strain ATCC 10573 / BCRC 21748 / CBS 615 / JCM 9827 / NBRC 10315 / NRRL Y-1498 / VKM Y-70) TaxID=590646 RepID=G3B4A7_CANTC|nr:uncharacterized protein CANTEDRAFT_93444 [Yamadazyma tenuis ATCC 10573]EGV63938.1 hypothetical protein CANTEDRAFT_93444 [Yamadazyma tenuis ATCC 10573]